MNHRFIGGIRVTQYRYCIEVLSIILSLLRNRPPLTVTPLLPYSTMTDMHRSGVGLIVRNNGVHTLASRAASNEQVRAS